MMADGLLIVLIIYFIVLIVVKSKDYIVTNAGTIVTFRSDNLIWDFKNLSVREIIPGEKIYNQP